MKGAIVEGGLMRRVVGIGLMLLSALVGSGCKRVTEGARERFSKDFTCPIDRVEVRERTDLRPSDFEDRAKPSKEIAADPERLKMWQAEQDTRFESMNRGDTIVEARGCDQQRLYACHRHNKDASYVMCSTKPYRDGIAKW